MKKSLIYLLAAIIIVFTQCGGPDGDGSGTSDKQKNVENGDGSTSGDDVDDGKIKELNKYERGDLTRESRQDIFDDQGNRIERTETVFDKYGEPLFKRKYAYKYDKKGNQIYQDYTEISIEGKLRTHSENHKKFDKLGQIIEMVSIVYDENKVETSWLRNTYKYNSYGRMTEEIQHGKNGNPRIKSEKFFEGEALVKESYTYYNPDGTVKEVKTLEFNKDGGVVKSY